MEEIFKLLEKYEGLSMSCMYYDGKLIIKVTGDKKYKYQIITKEQLNSMKDSISVLLIETLFKSVLEGEHDG